MDIELLEWSTWTTGFKVNASGLQPLSMNHCLSIPFLKSFIIWVNQMVQNLLYSFNPLLPLT